MTRVIIRIAEVSDFGCTIEIGDRLYEEVLVPYANLQVGQLYEANVVSLDPLHLTHWRKKDGDVSSGV